MVFLPLFFSCEVFLPLFCLCEPFGGMVLEPLDSNWFSVRHPLTYIQLFEVVVLVSVFNLKHRKFLVSVWGIFYNLGISAEHFSGR